MVARHIADCEREPRNLRQTSVAPLAFRRRAGVKVDDRAKPEIHSARAFRYYSRLLHPIMS